MRCSICDHPDTRFVYSNWHCFKCEDSIRQAAGDYREEDILFLFEEDDTPGLPEHKSKYEDEP